MPPTFLYGSLIQSASIPTYALTGGVVSSSLQAVTWTVASASVATSASYAVTSSFAVTASYVIPSSQGSTLDGSIKILKAGTFGGF